MLRPSFHGFILALGLLGCGSPGPAVLLDGEVTGSFNGTPFTILHGIALKPTSDNVLGGAIMLSEAELFCGSEDEPIPEGHTALITLNHYGPPSFLTPPTVQFFQNTGTEGSTITIHEGTAQIIAPLDKSLTGTIAVGFTDAEGHLFELNGFFEVTTCPWD